MTPRGLLTAKHPLIREYYSARKSLSRQNVTHELALRTPFADLLGKSAPAHGWTFVAEVAERSTSSDRLIRPDGVLRDSNAITRGWWESKDPKDSLEREIAKKRDRGYRLDNTIFEDSQKAILFQNRDRIRDYSIDSPEELADLLNTFYAHRPPLIREFEAAVAAFQERLPDLSRAVNERIGQAHASNSKFQLAFARFHDLCRVSLNPNLSAQAVDEMLVQHLLTDRIVRTVFNNPDFVRQNVIAREVEFVIDALVSGNASRSDFLKGMDSFYDAIESTGRTLPDFTEKQRFINTVYERFFQGWCVKTADTHGIVYTPQPIVDFMCASVAEILQRDFGVTLGDPSVQILDPATGTGNFIVNLLDRIPRAQLRDAYRHRLFANEVMLLPYYIAALNIEHRYLELTGTYEPFTGLCFTDTLDIAEKPQLGLFAEQNTERVAAQRKAPINVIIGNPPYNVGQLNENDNNKNRKYEVIDKRVRDTYSKDSAAQNRNSLSDVYVKFFRWAADRLGKRDGIVCLITNNGFVTGIAADGMRKHLSQDFTEIYHFDCKGNARSSGQRRQMEGGNVFDDTIRVGVGITLLVRRKDQQSQLRYFSVPDYSTSIEKREQLAQFKSVGAVPWKTLSPDPRHAWLIPENADEYATFLPITEIFEIHSNGLKSNRDEWVYDFNPKTLADRMKTFIETYNAEVDRWKRTNPKPDVDSFVVADERRIKWSGGLKQELQRLNYTAFEAGLIRPSVYRPFVRQWVYFDKLLNERVYQLPRIFQPGTSNQALWVKVGTGWPFFVLAVDNIPDLLPQSGSQVFPLHRIDADATNSNIYESAINAFQAHYGFKKPAAEQLFHYVYAILHHPGYRAKFAHNLKLELPRIPFAPDFAAFAAIGADLADLHVNYENATPYPRDYVTNAAYPASYKVEDKMRWLDKDKTALNENVREPAF